MERIDDETPGHQPGITASKIDLPSILPASLPLKTPDSLQKFVVRSMSGSQWSGKRKLKTRLGENG
jgi:hypothetical protein